MANNQLDIFQKEDGFYVGRRLKSGKMAAGSYHITGEDIMTMFTTLFQDFCKESGQQQMLMQDADGQLFVVMKTSAKVKTEKVKE